MSNNHYSFEEWCIDNHRQDLLERWDKQLNKKLPSQISYKSNSKYWFLCPCAKHDSELHDVQYVTSGRCQNINCDQCGSFAQAMIDKYGEDSFNKIWSDKNTLNPWKIKAHSKKQGIFNCYNGIPHTYPQSFDHALNGIGCGYCHGNKESLETSIGAAFDEAKKLWSKKNNRNVMQVSAHSQEKVWWKCKLGKHEDYLYSVTAARRRNFACPKCGIESAGNQSQEDLTGQRFGELTVLCRDTTPCHRKTKKVMWICECSCGELTTVDGTSLKNGNTKSCGNRTIHYSGKNNGNWQGGVTPERIAARVSLQYNRWRDAVYKKDWYTCQCCGRSSGINKEAHHLVSFAQNPELRYDIANGILLCDQCHSAVIPGGFHYIYGPQTTPENLEEFINVRRLELGITVPFSILKYRNGEIIKPNELQIAL